MKNGYRVILMALAVLGIVYASAGPEKKKTEEVKQEAIEKCLKSSIEPEEKTEEVEEKAEEKCKYNPLDICKFPLSIKVGYYIQLKECNKRKITLVQVDCKSIGRGGSDFPCYKGSDVIEVKANFPAIFSASIEKNDGGEDMLEEVNLYWENGVNTIQGTGDWEELKLCIEAWKVKIWKSAVIGTVDIGEITIDVKPPDETQEEKDAQATLQQELEPDSDWPTREKALEEVSPEAINPSEEDGDVVHPPE
ncbi:MAG: hypothetical protein ACYS6K_02340 [Planctomycetota bacterium]|jgi:hypothetical protein